MKRRVDTVRQIVLYAKEAIYPWVPTYAFEKHVMALERYIFDPAVKLHLAMCTSTSQYCIEIPEQALNVSWTLRDIGTWMKVKKLNETKGGIHCLYPAIVQRGVGDKDGAVLVKPVFIVNLPLALNDSSLRQG